MKRFLGILLALMLVLGMVSAVAEGDEKVVLKVFYDSVETYPGWEYGEDPISGWVEEQCGVDVQYTYATTSDHTELYTMMASGKISEYDAIICGTYIAQLVDEEFVVALDELATANNYEDFFTYMPTGLMGAHGINGHLYYTPSQYADDELLKDAVAGKKAPANFTINYTTVCKKLGIEEGSDLSTLAKIEEVCALAKDAGIEYPLFLTCVSTDPTQGLCWGQTMNNCFGGPGSVFPLADGTVTFNYKSEEYKKGIQWLNQMYQKGYVQADNLTFTASTNDQSVKQIALEDNLAFIIGHSWTVEMHRADQQQIYRRWKVLPAGEGVAEEDLKAMCWNGSNIGTPHGWILADSDKQMDVLRWFVFQWKPEVQPILLYGFEGQHYVWDYTYSEDGEPAYTYLDDQANMSAVDFTKKWGRANNMISSFRGRYGQIYVDRPSQVVEKEGYPDGFVIGDYDCNLGEKYAVSFKTGNLTLNITDPDQAALLANLKKVWYEDVCLALVAADDAAFEAAWDKLCADMETTGMAEMEQILTERYWAYADELHETYNAKWEAAVTR